MTDLAPDESVVSTDYEIYTYDSEGNITSVTTKSANSTIEQTVNYTYESVYNPYYFSFQKYYELTYYLENYMGLNVYNDHGLTPNIITALNVTYDVDNDNYPTTQYTSTDEISFTYTD